MTQECAIVLYDGKKSDDYESTLNPQQLDAVWG